VFGLSGVFSLVFLRVSHFLARLHRSTDNRVPVVLFLLIPKLVKCGAHLRL